MSLGPKVTNNSTAPAPGAPPAMQGADALKLGTDASADPAQRAVLGRLKLRVAKQATQAA